MMSAAAAVVVLPPLSEAPLQPAREPDAQLLPVLAEMSTGHDSGDSEEWWVLRDCLGPTSDEDGPDDRERSCWIVLQQALGIAIVTVGTGDAGTQERLRDRLRLSGFGEMFAGELPIVSVTLDSAADPAVSFLDRIRSAFANTSTALSVEDPDWPEWVVDVLTPAPSERIVATSGPASSATATLVSLGPCGPVATTAEPIPPKRGDSRTAHGVGERDAIDAASPPQERPSGSSRRASAVLMARPALWAAMLGGAVVLGGVVALGSRAGKEEAVLAPQAVHVALEAPTIRSESEPLPVASGGEGAVSSVGQPPAGPHAAMPVGAGRPAMPADGRSPAPAARSPSTSSVVTAEPPAKHRVSRTARRASPSSARRATVAARRHDVVSAAVTTVSSTFRTWRRDVAAWWRRLPSQPTWASRRDDDR